MTLFPDNPQCSVLECKLPRDEEYCLGYFCWCTLHGQYFAVQAKLKKEWKKKIDAANNQL